MGTWAAAAESHNATPVPAPGCGHSWGSLPTPPEGREDGRSGGRGNSSCPLNLLLTPSLSSPEPHSSSERSRVPQLPAGVRETHCIPKEAKLEGGTYPKCGWSLLSGCGMWHVPQPLGEQGRGRGQCLQNALKIKRVVAGVCGGAFCDPTRCSPIHKVQFLPYNCLSLYTI